MPFNIEQMMYVVSGAIKVDKVIRDIRQVYDIGNFYLYDTAKYIFQCEVFYFSYGLVYTNYNYCH